MGPLPRRLVAEFVGTIFLVLFGAGAVVTALQAGNGTLAYGGLGFVALSFGLAIAVATYAFGTTSGAVTAGVGPGSTVYVAGAGPVGLAAAYSAMLLGASVVIVGDLIGERLEQARSFGAETIDISKGDPKDQIDQILGVPEVDAAVDAVGFEARGHGEGSAEEAPATVLNSIMDVTRVAGKLGIPGHNVTGDPGAADDAAKEGSLSVRIGLGWAKSHSFATGQCPVMRYNLGLMTMILKDRAHIADAVDATVVTLDEAPQGYKDFDKGAAKKFVLNPNGLIAA